MLSDTVEKTKKMLELLNLLSESQHIEIKPNLNKLAEFDLRNYDIDDFDDGEIEDIIDIRKKDKFITYDFTILEHTFFIDVILTYVNPNEYSHYIRKGKPLVFTELEQNDIPLICYIRKKADYDNRYLIITTTPINILIGDYHEYTYSDLFKDFEMSTDLEKWKECKKIKEE